MVVPTRTIAAAVLNGNMIIVTHTPATLAESIIIGKILCLYLIEELRSLIKLLSNLLLIVGIRCHHHDATNLHIASSPAIRLPPGVRGKHQEKDPIWYLPQPDEVPEEPSPHDRAWQPASQSP